MLKKKKAVPGGHLGVQEERQALWKPEHTFNAWVTWKENPASCSSLFRALNLTEGKGKTSEGSRSLFTDQATEGGGGAERQQAD